MFVLCPVDLRRDGSFRFALGDLKGACARPQELRESAEMREDADEQIAREKHHNDNMVSSFWH